MDRIGRAHAEGRIGTADRDIRLANVRSAQSMAELDLIGRELDQLDATAPFSRFEPPAGGGDHGQAVSISGRALAIAFAVILAIALVVGGVVFVSARDSQSGDAAPADTSGNGQVDKDPEVADPGDREPDPPAEVAPPPGPTYALTGAGIRGFLTTYEKRFGTTRVVDLTLYGDYAIVNVPVPGKARQSGWLFRDNTWTPFGGVRAVFPGSQIVDTRQLAIQPLLRNIKRARATLNVEEPTQTYVIVRFIRQADDVPSVDIHVANEFRESGYLATTLGGTVERAYPYAS